MTTQPWPVRLAFLLTVAWGAAFIWLAPHPPMIDLAQHAGQLALLKQMLAGGSPWTPLFQINPVTPYFIGFALTLPLTYVLPVAAAMKLVLSLAYVAFVGMCVVLRRHFGADARLDWLFVCSFFGFAWHWGFFTFLTAAPLGLLFILLADRQARSGSLRHGLQLLVTGLVLLVSHGLVFLFALITGVLLLVLHNRQQPATLLRRAWPHAGVVLGLLAYYVARGPTEALLALPPTVPSVMWQLGLRHEVLTYAFGLAFTPLFIAAAAAFAVAPWLMGLRIDRRRACALLPFTLLALGLNFVPSFMFETSFVYQRFALFLFPAYAWIFTAPQSGNAAPAPWRSTAAVGLLMLTCWSVLGLNSVRTWNFGKEAADFDRVTSRIEPGQRALGLVFDKASPASGDSGTYVHYTSWYQAEHQGLVDFNFAWVPPQIVRYRVDQRPAVSMKFAWFADKFDWTTHQGDLYRYFIVRGSEAAAAKAFQGAPCAPVRVQQSGLWQVYERAACPVHQGSAPRAP